jgi:hypothetical protein
VAQENHQVDKFVKIWLTSLDSVHGVNPMVQRMFDIPEFEKIHPVNGTRPDVVLLSLNHAPELFKLDQTSLELFEGITGPGRVPVIILDTMEGISADVMFGLYHIVGPYGPVSRAIMQAVTHYYFKRELLSGDNRGASPIDWVLQAKQPPEMHTREQFEARPIDIFYCWGYSSEDRPKMMGELLKQAGRFCAHFCLTEEDLDRALAEGRKRIFALLHVPHYRRIHYSKIFAWQQQSKISLSIRGAGFKCFRHAEASYNCAMAHQSPEVVKWSFPWVGGVNCLSLPKHQNGDLDVTESLQLIWHWLRVEQGKLWEIYEAGVANCQNYYAESYSRNYLLPKIREALK